MADADVEPKIQGRREGVDNPSATRDDGTNLRPDLVISVQPQLQHGYTRAPLPVNTVDWQSNPRGQFIPVHGLDFLIGVNTLLIKQTVEINEITSKVESENRYIVKVPRGEALFIASEVSSSTQRCLCGSGRAFVMHLHDNTRQEALQLRRRLAAASCCLPCRLQEMQVITPPGDYIGRVQQQWTFMVPFYLVRDASDDVLFVIEGPTSFQRSALEQSDFKIMSGDSLRVMGRIVHGWDRELVSFTTTLHMPDSAVQPKHKALLLAATFLMNRENGKLFVCLDMLNNFVPDLGPTNTRKVWPYDERYIGEKDKDERRSGHGENHWSGAESLEWYTGKFLRDTMHGPGDYRWRYLGAQGSFITFEGHFYANHMHGYGTMSYPDGRVFTGLYHGDWRWGPGVMSHPNAHEDVGLWRGGQLVRLAWKPDPPGISLIPDFFVVPRGREFIEPHRLVLTSSVTTVDSISLELCNSILKTTEPRDTKHVCSCTQPCFETRLLCHKELFENAYYGKQIQSLKEIDTASQGNMTGDNYACYSWNKNSLPLHMMKHCFKHEHQRDSVGLDLVKVMSGPRDDFKSPGEHERSCRSLLMASYLGNGVDVDRILNEQNIYIDVADMLGNTVLMYATCGNQHELMKYLVVAGAAVDNCNDAGLTPLGVALMMYVATQHDYTIFNVIRGLLPPETQQLVDSPCEKPMILEWNIDRESPPLSSKGDPSKSPDRHSRIYRSKSTLSKPQSLVTLKSVFSARPSMLRRSGNTSTSKFKKDKSRSTLKITRSTPLLDAAEIIELCTEEEQIYKNIILQYQKRVNERFSAESWHPQIPYLFAFQNMDGQPNRKISVKPFSRKSSSKFKLTKSSPEYEEWHEKNKMETLIEIRSTIAQLLSDGADPRLVRCPQPALVMAMAAESADLVRSLLQKGADVNERYPQFSGFTPLDIAISRPLSPENAELVRALLENKASVDHRLSHHGENEPGPTLLHVLMSKEPINETQREARIDILKMLLDRGCDACALFNGSSVIDAVVTTKSLYLLDIFIKSLHGNLNRPINRYNQTLLVKMFTMPCFKQFSSEERVQILTRLLVHGADPLLECQNESETYPNILVYAQKSFQETLKKRKTSTTSVGSKPHSPSSPPESSSPKNNHKTKQNKSEEGVDKKRTVKISSKRLSRKQSPSSTKSSSESVYREALSLVSDWARMMQINWIQTTLMKELVQVVNKFKHRSWHLIIRDHKNRSNVCLWLSTKRCLELWDILKETKQDVYKDNKVLKFLLCIVQYYKTRQNEETKFTFQEKELLESDVTKLLHEHIAVVTEPTQPSVSHLRGSPKSDEDNVKKFNVCFECSLPLSKSSLLCDLCGLVSFCNVTCMIENCTRGALCHPCSDHLTGVICPFFEDTSIIYSGANRLGALQHGDINREESNHKKRRSKGSSSQPQAITAAL